MELTFYAITDDYRKLDKTLGTALGSSAGDLHERVNDLQFTVRLPGTMAAIVGGANYAHVDLFGKYYFVEGIDIQNNTVYVNLREDVRMNFATQIKATTATINRSASMYQGFLYDSGYQLLAYKTAAIRNFPTAIDDDVMILTTVG